MSSTFSWEKQFLNEIEKAKSARAQGNEGRSRVCARRAAGIIADQYFIRNGIPVSDPSAYSRLQLLNSLPNLPASIHEIIDHFTMHVSEEFKLPQDIDLIAEAVFLADELLGPDLSRNWF